MKRQHYPRSSVPGRVLGLDFGKYLLSKDKRVAMESDITTGTDSDTSDLDPVRWPGYVSENRSSEYSEDSDDFQGYYDDGRRVPGVYDTSIDSVADDSFYDHYQGHKGQKRGHEDENDLKIRQAIAQLNAPVSNNNFGRPLYAIHETSSVVSESSVDNSDSQTGTPVHKPVYGRYQKLPNQNAGHSSSSNQHPDNSDSESLETLILHRLPGENLGMILGIEGGKDDSGKVSHVLVKSVTLGGAAYRATGSSIGVCVSDEILKVNGIDVRTLSHDECISVFKDMPLRVSLGVRRGQKNLPPVQISPDEAEKIDRKFDFHQSAYVYKNTRYDYSDSEEEKMTGFAMYKVTIEKEPYENLGLSIVPSYGSTKEFYQIKRILPSGAASQSRQLKVGDRLITCNGQSLKQLTQNHCLNILKSASARGDVDLEVIRPVDHGNPMEISVTLNNNNTHIPGLDNSHLSRIGTDHSGKSFDPSQYSLKSLSYDRQVDVIVTSESEDYLTLSEDEYSKNRLGNISEAKAHEVFSSKGPKLAYQKPFTGIDELSSENDTVTETETEAEGSNLNNKTLERDKEVDIVDLNIASSPYHIPKKLQSEQTSKDSAAISDPDHLIVSSVSKKLNSEPNQFFQYSKTVSDPLKFSSFDKQSPNSGVDIHVNENIVIVDSDIPKTVESSLVWEPYIHPRQQLPALDIDTVSSDQETEEIEIVEDTECENPYYSEFNIGIGGIEYPENHIYDNGEEDFELSDSEKYFQPVSDSEEAAESALPPPEEFSDSNFVGEFNNNSSTIIPVSYIDDFTGDSSEPIQQDIEVIRGEQEQEYPEAELAKLEASLRDLDEASSDQPKSVPYLETLEEDFELHHLELPQSYEVTVNNQRYSCSNKHEVSEFETNTLSKEYEITVNDQIIPKEYENVQGSLYDTSDSREKKNFDQDQILITQVLPKNHNHFTRQVELENHNNNSTMNDESEAVLKNVLDMEYDMIPESEKFQARITLGGSEQPGMAELDDPSFMHENVVAECLVQEMIKSEQNNYGYYTDSDEEPDLLPEQDMHDEPPDLPDLPPPVLDKHDSNTLSNDPNWTFKMKDSETKIISSEYKISPTIAEQTSEVRAQISVPKFQKADLKTDSEVIIPVKVERNQNIPTKIFVNNKSGEVFAPKTEVIIEPKATVTVSSVKPKSPSSVAPKPSPRKINENKVGKNVAVVQLQHVDEYADRDPVDEPIIEPAKVTKDKAQQVVNVVKVVSAFKDQNAPNKRPISPKEMKFIKELRKNEEERQSPPPRREIIETEKGTVHKTKADLVKKMQEISQESHSGHERSDKSPVQYKTQIQHANELDKKVISDEVKVISNESKLSEPKKATDEVKVVSSTPPPVAPKPKKANTVSEKVSVNLPDSSRLEETEIPRLNLDSIESSESSSIFPKSNKSDSSHGSVLDSKQETKHEAVNKTIIGISKPDSLNKDVAPISEKKDNKPLSEVKPLSQIKPLSFNPKSLSKPQPVQYKTAINTLGLKPGGIGTLGRSSLLSTQKAEHPIKRMETMPFEVSILKGILGIGIKTKITPEGHVQITEILPSGPVGREGNIKVGDYLLSINNTELSGLPDGKVQQILRLLPRGLSKIVASPVPPEQGAKVQNVAEKKTLSPRTSVPLSTSQQKAATLPRSLGQVNIISPKQQIVSTKSLPFASKPFSSQQKKVEHQLDKEVESPVTSPRSPKSKLTPALAPRKRVRHSSSESLEVSPRSPPISPRKAEAEKSSSSSEKSSPRTPPPVAPKPRRDIQAHVNKPNDIKMKQNAPDEMGPIETEIFASITGPKSEHIPSPLTGPTILPGSVTLDFVPINNTKGKVDVVGDTGAQKPITEAMLDQKSIAPQHEAPIQIDVVENIAETPDDNSTEDILEIDLSFHKLKESEHEPSKSENDSDAELKIFDQEKPKTLPSNSPEPKKKTYTDIIKDNEMQDKTIIPCDSKEEDICVQAIKESESDSDKAKPKTPPASSPELTRKTNTNEDLSKPNYHLHEDHVKPYEIEIFEKEDTCVQKSEMPTPEPPTSTDNNLTKPDEHSTMPYEPLHTETDILKLDSETESKGMMSEPSDGTKHEELKSESIIDSDYHFRAPVHIDDIIELTETRLERAASVSSESSYTEFQECDVQDESNLDDIEEEIDTDMNAPDNAIKDTDDLENKHIGDYESIAQHIVSDVMETVKAMALSERKMESPDIFVDVRNDLKTTNSFEFPDSSEDSPPPLPENDAPPLPSSPPPIPGNIPANEFPEPVTHDSFPVKESDTVKSPLNTEDACPAHSVEPPSQSLVEDLIEVSHTSQVHASVPEVVVAVHPDDIAVKFDVGSVSANVENAVYSQDKLKVITDEQAEYTDDFDESSTTSDTEDFQEANLEIFTETTDSFHSVLSSKEENLDDQSINTVISMYGEIGKSSFQKADDTEKSKVNGFSQKDIERPRDLRMDVGSDKADSSFSSDSALSPARSGTPHSDDDRVDVDRMIRLLSVDSEPQHVGEGEIIKVRMNKGVTGVGFVIQGGKGSPKGDLPITIKRIFKGGPADQCGQLLVNDEILDVNGENLTGMKHSEAWHHLKFLPSGEVTMTIRRYTS